MSTSGSPRDAARSRRSTASVTLALALALTLNLALALALTLTLTLTPTPTLTLNAHTNNKGVMKPQFLHMSKSPPLIGLMRGVKTLLDPHNILNPGKVLPPIAGVDGQAHTKLTQGEGIMT